MIAGRSPFDAATSQDTLVAILQKNPPALRTYVDVPDELQWIVTKALSKDVEERYQSTKDFLTDLKRIRKRLEIDEELKRSGSTGIAQSVRKKTTRAAIVFALLIAAAIIAFFLTRASDKKITATTLPFSKIKVTRLTATGSAWGGVISSDAKYIAYRQESEKHQQTLYLRQLKADTEIPILKVPEKNRLYDWRFSSDGEHIFYIIGEPGNDMTYLYKMPALGGISRRIIDNIHSIPTFSPTI